ncbi:conserved protein of unknown function [Limnospira indica PCC 8005]|uniref:Uncharacterized protein n=1 Tax=Limnospira indica PCC 8005 TaxID=376219 RepID=A0A9P1NXX5_9CYAN|nr:conserved protein of unknown function [Limnospira indica PCC 8005]
MVDETPWLNPHCYSYRSRHTRLQSKLLQLYLLWFTIPPSFPGTSN